MRPRMRSTCSMLILALFLACTEAAEDVPVVGEAASVGEVAAQASSSDAGAALTIEMTGLPDGCDVVDQGRAREILSSDVVARRRGGGCGWAATSGSGHVRILYTPLPLESMPDDDRAMASMIQLLGQLDGPPESVGRLGGGRAFEAEQGGTSGLFVLSGVETTAVMSDRPVGEVLIQVSLTNDRTHTERMQTLRGIADGALEHLRAAARGELPPAPGPFTDAPREGSADDPEPAPGEAVSAARTTHPELGDPRDDLERFHGVYGDPDGLRNFFVARASSQPDARDPIPPGYLMVGAMWGDVAPWYLRSLSEVRFEQVWVGQFQEAPLRVTFELGPDGHAVALRFETLFDDRGRLERVGDLPEGW